MGLLSLDIWRRNRQREMTQVATAVVANIEWQHAAEKVPTGQLAIVGRDLARQLEVSTAWTRMFANLRDIEAQYDLRATDWLEQYAELVAYLDELEARA
jgi:hypothetical protein